MYADNTLILRIVVMYVHYTVHGIWECDFGMRTGTRIFALINSVTC